MAAFWEKLARKNLKLLRTGSFSRMDIFGLSFWVIHMIFPKSWILRKQRRLILNTRLVLIVLLQLLLHNIVRLKDKNKSNKIRDMWC